MSRIPIECPNCRERPTQLSFKKHDPNRIVARRLEVEEEGNWKTVYICPKCKSPFIRFGVFINVRLLEVIVFVTAVVLTLMTYGKIGDIEGLIVFFLAFAIGRTLKNENLSFKVVELYNPEK